MDSIAGSCLYIVVSVASGRLSVFPFYIFDPGPDLWKDDEFHLIDFENGGLMNVSIVNCASKDPCQASSRARAYTLHGMPLVRGKYVWGDSKDVYPYSEDLLQILRGYERTNDISGYERFFDEKTEYMPGINFDEE